MLITVIVTSYKQHVPAIDEVKFSLISNRGCFGSCNFCALAFHQGRIVQARSHESIISEASKMVWDPEFKGYIHDVGGPTETLEGLLVLSKINMVHVRLNSVLWPKACNNLEVSHQDYLELLRKLKSITKLKKVFVRSGIRYDYLMYDKDDTFFKELVQNDISGQLKVAPEHIS